MSSLKIDENIEYKVLTTEHIDDVVHMLAAIFVQSEPLNVALKVSYDEQLILTRNLCEKAVEDRASSVALDTHTGNVIGASIGAFISGEDLLIEPEDYVSRHFTIQDETPRATSSWKLNMASEFVKEAEKFYHRHPKLKNLDKNSKILKSFKVGVLPDYSGHGIGTKLVRFRNDLVKQRGGEFVCVICTSVRSEKLYSNVGYEVIGEVVYSDFDVDGERPFADITASTSAKVMLKVI